MCIEFGTKRAQERTPGGELTLAWPISARAAAPTEENSAESSTIDPTSPVRKTGES